MSLKPETIASELKKKLRGGVYADTVVRNLYATDASMFRILPSAVVEPHGAEDVAAVLDFARTNGVRVAPRGAGSGLAGESLTSGIVMDFSVHMNQMLDMDPEGETAKVQPGVVWGAFNRDLSSHGKIFGPDPATGNRCTLGGMIANNSTGAHSLRYGMTERWVKRLKLMLEDGTIIETGQKSPSDLEALMRSDSREGKLYQSLVPLLKDNRKLIDDTWPNSPRNRHGYLLKHVLNGEGADLSKVICASEGTLGIVLEADMGFCDKPAASTLVAFLFTDRIAAAEATVPLLEYDPCAIEIIDEFCLNLARTSPVYRDLYGAEVKSLLLVEFDGTSDSEVQEKVTASVSALAGQGKPALEAQICDIPAQRKTVWEMRKLIAGFLGRYPGKLKPVPLIEDASLPADKLANYFRGLDSILGKRGVEYLCFGHAGDGTAHVRPIFDLRDPASVDMLPELCEEVYSLTIELGGSISGEHGDGLLRAPFIKKQYGELFPVFERVKDIFDPKGILNPDKKTGCRDFKTWSENLRYGKEYRVKEMPTELNWQEGTFTAMAEDCNGCSACKSALKDTDMCPMYRAFGIEMATPRAKANLIRNLLSGRLDETRMEELAEVASYCINCQMCGRECPAGVSAAKLMLELKAQLAKHTGVPLQVRMLALMDKVLNLASNFPWLHNAFAKMKMTRLAGKFLAGVSPERPIPILAKKSFSASHPELKSKPGDKPGRKVALFTDLVADIIQPEISEALLFIMKKHGVEVVLPPQTGCGILHLNYGMTQEGRATAKKNIGRLLPYAKAGYKILCTEPTAALMLREEYSLYDDSEDTKTVSAAVQTWSEYVAGMRDRGELKTGDMCAVKTRVGYHAPCHLKVLEATPLSPKLLSMIPQLEVREIDEGCCGIAGTFGMREKGHKTSLEIGRDLFCRLASDDFDSGCTDCSTCKLQMEYGVPQKSTLHPVVLLARSFGFQDGGET